MLARVASILDRPALKAHVAALEALHAEPKPNGEAEALIEVARRLELMREELASLPVRAKPVELRLAGDPESPGDLDAAVRWLGARTTDMLSTIRPVVR